MAASHTRRIFSNTLPASAAAPTPRAPQNTSNLSPKRSGEGHSQYRENVRMRRTPSRRNPWGKATYAELISMAINSSPLKMLRLAEMYHWLATNIPYFKEMVRLGDDKWKNALRHTLSINDKFLKTANKQNNSSQWFLNPDMIHEPPKTLDEVLGPPAQRKTASSMEHQRGLKRTMEHVTSAQVASTAHVNIKSETFDEEDYPKMQDKFSIAETLRMESERLNDSRCVHRWKVDSAIGQGEILQIVKIRSVEVTSKATQTDEN